jgi:hypothetical protein
MEASMSERSVDPWRKAAACEAHAQASRDGKIQEMFRKLRDSWLRIGKNAQLASDIEENAKRLDRK